MVGRLAHFFHHNQRVDMDRQFDERKRKYEDKWALDEELRFKANARRNKLLGRWAAAELGLSGDEAEAYARTVINADFQEPGDEDVFRKVRDDFRAKGVPHSDETIHQKMRELVVTARDQIVNGA
jgi:hypothetical protein